MSRKTDAIKKLAVAMGYAEAVTEFNGNTVSDVLKEVAVKMQCAPDVDTIKSHRIADVLIYIADNYGEEEKEPYDLAITGDDHVTLTVKLNGKTATEGSDMLYNGDKLKITAALAEGYEIDTLTANDETIESGDEITVDNASVTIVATSKEIESGNSGEDPEGDEG